jgi:hypothetical protein
MEVKSWQTSYKMMDAFVQIQNQFQIFAQFGLSSLPYLPPTYLTT